MTRVGRTRTAALLAALLGALVVSGCGDDDDFENKPRPPVPVQLSGVITDSEVSVEPRSIGAGPIVLIVSNQTEQAHTVTLDGPSGTEEVGPINPLDTGRIQHNLNQGTYEIRAGSDEAVDREITAAKLAVGPPRPSSSNDVLLP
ncbi:MAG TPA: hypothetical protein VF712_01145 [Thermoleophilaceae bacterium]|jgi:hypothetical protein